MLPQPSAHLGKDIENGARLAIEDMNATGPQIGGRNIRFVLQVEDDAGDPKQGTAVAQKRVDAEVAGVVGIEPGLHAHRQALDLGVDRIIRT